MNFHRKNKEQMNRLIFRNFIQFSLIPILTSAFLLLLLYFGVNTFIARENKSILVKKSLEDSSHILSGQVKAIHNELKAISSLSKILQAENQRFFESPLSFIIPGERPVFEVAQNGVFYKKTKAGSSLFYSSTTKIGEKEYQKALNTESFDPLFRIIQEKNPSIVAIYFNSFDGMNRYYPFIDDVYTQFDPCMRMQDFNFYYMADQQHNPQKETAWTPAYVDPAGKGWMVSCIAPIYNKDFLEGVTGIDITIDAIVKNILGMELPWDAHAFLLDSHGMILAMPEKVEEYLGLKELKEFQYQSFVKKEILKPEEYNIFKHKDKKLVKNIERLLRGKDKTASLKIQEDEFLLVYEPIPQIGWNLLIMMKVETIFKPIYEWENLTNQIGYIVLAIILVIIVFFSLYLLRKAQRLSQKIAAPISYLTEATGNLGKNFQQINSEAVGIEEIDKLSYNFNRMSSELETRTKELIESHTREKLKEKEAQVAYNAGLFESASSYLHNIGNSLVGIDGKIIKIKNVLNSMSRYSEIFHLIKQSHLDSFQKTGEDKTMLHLEKFESILVKEAIPRLSQSLDEIVHVKERIVLTIRHQQDAYNLNKNKEQFIQKFYLKEVLLDVLYDFQPSLEKRKIQLDTNFTDDLVLSNHKLQITHGIINLIKNSISAIDLSENKNHGKISIEIHKSQNEKAVLYFIDNGIGISKENIPNVFKAGFTTKKDGHGLGLHSFVNFLNEHNGAISVVSEGENRGTKIILEIGNV
ncbi:MAG: ATP-binding protein [Candidatus Brocadiae bacterium]|nr:ATP-binding protein [Candidatus Brocadiia bacterium]